MPLKQCWQQRQQQQQSTGGALAAAAAALRARWVLTKQVAGTVLTRTGKHGNTNKEWDSRCSQQLAVAARATEASVVHVAVVTHSNSLL
jgi:hypothetical protein